MLAVPDFTKPFVLETDAFKFGIGVVPMQANHRLTFISRSLGPRWKKLVYENELLAIVFVVQK